MLLFRVEIYGVGLHNRDSGEIGVYEYDKINRPLTRYIDYAIKAINDN